LTSIVAKVNASVATNLAWLGTPMTGARLRIVLVGSRDEMRPLTSSTPGGWSETGEGTAFFVANDSIQPALRHEIMHLLSWRLWGPPAGIWLSEGVASVAGGSCRGYGFAQVAAAMDHAGRLVPFDSVRHQFVFAGEQGAIDYLESASVVDYLDRTFGRAKLRALWTSGLSDSPRLLGRTAPELEVAWREEIRKTRAPASWDVMWSAINAHGCE
jgi:hypothetical protein